MAACAGLERQAVGRSVMKRLGTSRARSRRHPRSRTFHAVRQLSRVTFSCRANHLQTAPDIASLIRRRFEDRHVKSLRYGSRIASRQTITVWANSIDWVTNRNVKAVSVTALQRPIACHHRHETTEGPAMRWCVSIGAMFVAVAIVAGLGSSGAATPRETKTQVRTR
jgi:hypothetical protein